MSVSRFAHDWPTVITLSDEDDDDSGGGGQPDKAELQNQLRTLSAKLEDLTTCNDLITKHGAALQVNDYEFFFFFFWKLTFITNKKVFLRELKRHTARRVASACSVSWLGGGGLVLVPHPVPIWGVPPPPILTC